LVFRFWELGLQVSGVSDLVVQVHVGDNLDVAVVHAAQVDVGKGHGDLLHPDHLPFASTKGFSLERDKIPG
jgi:hypothetical protein